MNVIEVKNIKTVLGGKLIHDGVSLSIKQGDIHAIVGGSGSGKTVLVKIILGLLKPQSGQVKMMGIDPHDMTTDQANVLRSNTGVMFQDGALFTSLTVFENLMVPVKKWGDYDAAFMKEMIALKLKLVGLSPDVTHQYPSELSGGMRKRVSLARALILDPDILFLDEPTAGLDPVGAHHFDLLIKSLSDTLGLTTIMITHDLDSLELVTDQISLLLDKKIQTHPYQIFKEMREPQWIYDYFNGARAK